MNPKILVIYDDTEYQELVQYLLTIKEYKIDAVNDGIEGIVLYQKNKYDIIIIDVMLKQPLDGYSICKIIRSQSTVPIIMLSSIYDEYTEIKGFKIGIDDYITNPYSESFLYRIEALLRRWRQTEPMQLLQFEELTLNPDSYIVYLNGQKKKLTTKEFDILHVFLKNPGRVLSREFLINHIWGYDYYGDERVVDTYIKKLRKKLNIPYIKTITGVGYKIDT